MSTMSPVDPTASSASRKAAARRASPWRRLLGDRGGAVAIYFVLTMIPLMVAVGAAVDISRAYLVKQRLCYALDAAGLAVGSSTGNTEQLNAVLTAFFNKNYPTAEIGVPATPVLNVTGQVISVSAEATVDTTLMKVVGVGTTTVGCSVEITKSSTSLEVAMVLDITGSMAGTRIADLKVAAADLVDIVVQDVQTPNYTKVALVPYSQGVNVGSTYAPQVRGAAPGGKGITSIAWFKASSKSISGATKANPVVVTANSHGFVTGDIVRITGVSGMTQLNNNIYTVGTTTANTFQLSGVNGTGYNTYSSGGSARPCHVAGCAPVVTSTTHGFITNDRVYFTDISGTTQLNGNSYPITKLTNDTFALTGVNPFSPSLSNYSSGGNAWCTVAGCEYYYFMNNAGTPAPRVHRISTCATERVAADPYTDVAPSTTLVGRQYPVSGNPCPTAQITPLSADRTALKNAINAYNVVGSTAGHIGMAWGWYMVSPNFAYLWPDAAQKPAAYGTDKLKKIVVLMTDGAFNTPYCNGVIAADAGSGSGSNSDHINCNATNGSPYVQAQNLCTAMKAQNIVIYTVGFDIGSSVEAQQVLANCASVPANAFLPTTGAELKDSFKSIAQSISNLRLSK